MRFKLKTCATGVSLIEVLVSMVLLSGALLGTAKLTTASLASTNDAYFRSQATMLADDILDRMRANLPAARLQQFNTTPMIAPAGSMVLYDYNAWQALLTSTLPASTGTVSVNGAGVATIDIQWNGGGDENKFTTKSQL